MIYGYARVSTLGQGRDGNSLEDQVNALKEYGCEEIVTEAFSGKTMDRPQFQKLLNRLEPNDTLVVTKLDRFARSTIDGLNLIEDLLNRGIAVNVLNLGIINNTPNGKLIRTIFFAFAEWERDMIVERTSEGKYYARQREDYQEGRPRKEIPDFEKYLQKQKDGQMTVRECCAALGIGRRTWYNRVAELAS